MPTELLLNILKRVPTDTLVGATTVCKRWNEEKNYFWQANFKRYFPDRYNHLQQTDVETTDWLKAFSHEEKFRYMQLTVLQKKLFRVIKDSDLTNPAKLALEVRLSDLMARGAEEGTYDLMEVGMLQPDKGEMTILQWASFYGTCTSFIYEKIILMFYAEDRSRVYVCGKTLLHWGASLAQVQDIIVMIDNAGAIIEAATQDVETVLQLVGTDHDMSCRDYYMKNSGFVKILIIKSLENYINEINKSGTPFENNETEERKRSRFTVFGNSEDANLQSKIVAATHLLNILKGEAAPKIPSIHLEIFKNDSLLNQLCRYCRKHALIPVAIDENLTIHPQQLSLG